MPPRRSSRAPSVNHEASQPAENPPAKRKRKAAAQTDDDEAAPDAKPTPRAKRATSSKPTSKAQSKGRASTRSKISLPSVAESDDEPQSDSPPARKKSRPSVESDLPSEQAEEEEEEMVSKPKGRKAAQVEEDEEEEGEGEAPAVLLRRRTSARQSSAGPSRRPSSAAASRVTRTTRVASIAKSVPEEEEDADEVPAPPRKRGGRVAKKNQISDDEMQQSEEEQEYDSDKPKPKGRKGKAAPRQPKSAPKRAPKKVVVVESDSEDDEDDDSDSPPPPAQSRYAKSPMKKEQASPVKPTQSQQQQEDEEEKSLFDPIPAPTLAPPTQTQPEEPEGPKPRLVIHKMALVNFKSYAGRQEIGPFHKSFSAIVGPNGSGKSNTIDALLFVFGYRASKMRQGKVSELIHNSARYPDLDECSVEIHFRDIIDLPGSDGFDVVPNSKLVVARTAYKNNGSKYTINGKASSYTEVQTLLKGRGIDLDHNRFLILQGEVESIAQMKPKAPTEHEDGLLEYLEDIIGTSSLKTPIETAFTEFERLQEDRQTKLNRLRLVEKEKQALEEQRREAINYYKMKNDHVRAQSCYIQWLIWRYWEQHDLLESQKTQLTQDLEAETKRNKGNIDHLAKLTRHFNEKEEAFKLVRVEAEKATKDLKETEKKVVGLQEKQKHADSRSKKLKKSVNDETTALKKAHHDIKDATESLEKNRKELKAYEKKLVSEEDKLAEIQESLRDKTKEFHDLIQTKQKELAPWTTKIDAKQAEIDLRMSEQETLVERERVRKAALQDAEKALADLRKEQEARVDEQSSFKARKETLKRDLGTATKRHEDAQRNLNECRAKASSSRNRFEEARASQSANVSQGTVVNKLQALSDQGRLDGFHGKLGALGAIEGKYDVAISTACGGPLSNLVVDTVAEGKTCIEYLRANQLGRASFVILEKLADSNRMNPIATPENAPRLFDLVRPKDPKYRKAFYKALGDTLVAENLEKATRIAYGGTKRFRVVTLDGQVIEMSGAMSGGGSTPSKGAMSSKQVSSGVTPQTLKDYEADSHVWAGKLAKATEEARGAEDELENLKRAGPDLEMSYQKLGMEIETRKARISDVAKRVEGLRAQDKPDAADVARIALLDKEIRKANSELEKLQQSADTITEAIAELEGKIMDIGGSRLMTQKSTVDGLRTFISLCNDAINKAEGAQGKAENDVKRLTHSIKTNSGTLEEVLKELAELNEAVADGVEYRDQLQEEVTVAQAELENQQETLDGLKEEVDEAEAAIAGFRQREMELNQKLSNVAKELTETKDTLDRYETSHDNLRLQDIEDDSDDSDDEDEGKPEGTPADGDEDMKPDPDDAPPKAKKDLELRVYTADELRGFKQKELIADTELLDERIKNAKVDLTVLKEYKKREAEFDNRAKDVERVTEERDAQKTQYDALCKQRLDEFMAGFNTISLKLKEMYQMITLGGNAELELVDSLDPFSEGIIFSVMPPKKSWKNISNLSGGEKTLSSLALVFALHVFKPTPLYFMDEIDAALDFRNVSIVANYIKDRTKNAQFIIISLRNDMFELSHRLIGIYKTANATRSVSINNHKLHSTVPPNPMNSTAPPAPAVAA